MRPSVGCDDPLAAWMATSRPGRSALWSVLGDRELAFDRLTVGTTIID
jgi:hypothetical protein